jgi:uncharacterized protein involved in exopolysaccharide biosynthesis
VSATLYDYWQDLYERKSLVLIVAFSAAIFGCLISLVLSPVYEAKVTFYTPTNLNLPSYTRSETAGHFAQAPFLPTADEKAAAVDIGILLSQDVFRILHERFPQRDADALRKNVDVNVSDEFMIDIHVRDTDPELAADIANELPKLYREFHVRALRERLAAEVDTLSQQLSRLDGKPQQSASAPSDPDPNAQRVKDLMLQLDQFRVGQSVRDEMTRNLMEAKLQLQDPPVAVVVVQTGVPPTRPVFPLPALNTVVAGLTGAAAGAYYALLMGYLARLKSARIRREMDWSPFLDGSFIEFAKAQSAPANDSTAE